MDVVEAAPNKGVLGKTFKKDAKIITETLSQLKHSDVELLEKNLENNG